MAHQFAGSLTIGLVILAFGLFAWPDVSFMVHGFLHQRRRAHELKIRQREFEEARDLAP
jgi:hypothetical protein